MKKNVIALLALLLILTGCARTQSAFGTTSIPAKGALPASTQLILGTFRLEGTRDAVTAGQAAELLPLWQVYQELNGSGTAAQEEIDALVQQIQATMTSSQMKLIEGMGLTQGDVMAAMAEQELLEVSPQSSTDTTVAVSGPQGGPGGDMPPGDMAGGDPAMMGGAMPVNASSASDDSTSGQAPANAALPSVLLDALIGLLQSKVA